jgi:hypothetical protein
MTKKKLIAMSAGFIMILSFFVIVPVHAQDGVDFDIWEGQWFKGIVKDKGLVVDSSGTYRSVDIVPTYGYVIEWIPGAPGIGVFNAVLFQYDNASDSWVGPVPYTLNVIGGTPLDYVSYGFVGPDDPLAALLGVEIFTISLSVKGKVKNEDLYMGMAKSLGGLVIYDYGDESYFSANESLKMKLIPESKVPQEIIDLLSD